MVEIGWWTHTAIHSLLMASHMPATIVMRLISQSFPLPVSGLVSTPTDTAVLLSCEVTCPTLKAGTILFLFRPIEMPEAFTFIDIFDPKEQKRLEVEVKASCEKSLQNPENVIGYCWTDLGAWPLDNSTGNNWVDFIKSLPANAPGQQAYQEFVKAWKDDGTTSQDEAFLRFIAREYFRIVGTANRTYDPDHLIFGDRFSFQTFNPAIVEEMLPYVDAIAIQPYFMESFPQQKLDEIHRCTGKPILLCDFAIRFQDGDKNISAWKLAEDSVAAGKAYAEYVKAALNTSYILGVFWCNPVDTPKGFGKAGVKQGFFADGLLSRPGLHDTVQELNDYREKQTPRTGE